MIIRVGRQANTDISISRFACMFLRNFVGLRFSPDDTDKASITAATVDATTKFIAFLDDRQRSEALFEFNYEEQRRR